MFTYIIFFGSKQLSLVANSALEAQTLGHAHFQRTSRRKLKPYEVTVVLAARNDTPIPLNTGAI